MVLLLVVLCVVVGVLWYEVRVRTGRLYRAAARYPACHAELPVVGGLYRLVGNSEHTMKTMIKIGHQTMKMGGASRLVGLGNCIIVLTEAADAAEVLKVCLNKDKNYGFLHTLTGGGSVFNTDASASRVRRRAMMPAFSSERLGGYVRGVGAESARLADALETRAGRGPFRARRYLGLFCFNTIIRTAGILEIKNEISTEEMFDKFSSCLQLVLYRWTGLCTQLDFIHKLTSNYRQTEESVSLFYEYAQKAQDIRRQKLSRNSLKTKDDTIEDEDMEVGIFDSLLTSLLSNREVSEEILVIFGASDEAAIAIGFTLMLLGMYPAVQDRVYEELTNIFGDSDRPLDKDDLSSLQYLDNVIKESLRLYPPVPMVLRAAHKDITLSSGKLIPQGASIAVGIYGVHRSPRLWGADAEHFDPERFLPARLAAVPDHAYMPFSYGPRGCPAYRFASIIVKIGLCAILRRYRVVGQPGPTPAPRIRTQYEMVMKPVNDCEVELVSRI